jgi:hypothetical protein
MPGFNLRTATANAWLQPPVQQPAEFVFINTWLFLIDAW